MNFSIIEYSISVIIYRKLTTEEVEAIGTAFAAETNRRDEDTEMYIYCHNYGFFSIYFNTLLTHI